MQQINPTPDLAQLFLTLFAFFVIYILIKRFSRELEVSIIVLILLVQWLQCSIRVLYADILFENVERYFKISSEYEATVLSLIAILAFGLGIYYGKEWRRKKVGTGKLNFDILKIITLQQIILFYIATVIIDLLFSQRLFANSGFSQVGYFLPSCHL